MKTEVGDLRSACWSEANVREEINADAITEKDNRDHLEGKLLKSHSYLDQSESRVDQLTQHRRAPTRCRKRMISKILRPQVYQCSFTSQVNSLSFRVFAVSVAAQAATIMSHGI